MKKIMILGASELQVPAIREAQKLGLLPVVVDMNPNAVGFREENIVKVIESTIDKESVLRAAKDYQIDGIITLASDYPMRTVAYVADQMGLIGESETTARVTTDKGDMRKALQRGKVKIPDFHIVKDEEDFYRCCQKCVGLDKKFILKPADNSGSRGIVELDDFQEKKILRESYAYSRKNSRNGVVILEEKMEGLEVSVETISYKGECRIIQITDKLTTGAPNFVEMGHSQPSLLSLEMRRNIEETAIQANAALGIKCGPSHTEIIVTNEGAKVVEVGARLGGDCITTHLVPLSTGVNLVKAIIKIALGDKVDLEAKFCRGAAIRFFPSKNGVLESVSGLEEVRKMGGVRELMFRKKPGDQVRKIKNSTDRIGYVITDADDVETAVEICQKAIEKIDIQCREE